MLQCVASRRARDDERAAGVMALEKAALRREKLQRRAVLAEYDRRSGGGTRRQVVTD